MRIYDNIWKISTGPGDNYTTGCLVDYPYFNDDYKIIAIDLSKQQALHADPKAIQKVNFIGNINQIGCTAIFIIIEETKETVLDFLQGTCKTKLY